MSHAAEADTDEHPLVTECRDLHKILRDDDTPLIPLDHWGAGCPFAEVDSQLHRGTSDPSVR